jgi:hypothetical protein
LQNFFPWYIPQSWRPHIQLRPHHFLTYTPKLVSSVLKFMINGTTSTLKYKFYKYVQQYTSFSCIWCLHLAIDSQWPVAIILISWNVIFIWETGYWTRAMKKIRLIRFLKKFIFRYQDLVEIYSVSAETIINDAFSKSENV